VCAIDEVGVPRALQASHNGGAHQTAMAGNKNLIVFLHGHYFGSVTH
jgi:hypothetical protein